MSVLLVLFGCSSSNKPYTLMAQLPPLSKQQRIMIATIDVEGSECTVRVMTYAADAAWTPACAVNQDQPAQKNFTIDGQKVNFDAADGGFKVSNAPSLTLPQPATTAASATTAKAAATAQPAAHSQAEIKAAIAAVNAKGNVSAAVPGSVAGAAAATAAPTPEAFPVQWNVVLFPGHQQIVAQNLGYLVKSAAISIDGSTCKLDVVFKVRYPPYHLDCTVTTDQRGDYTLLFNPFSVANVALSSTNSILLDSEGPSISGIVWDSHGFDSWTPSVPPSWRVRTKSDN
ncbi:MAG: hypothetical protein WBR15_01950 [Gammaproteobacteria bacterium]